MAITRRIFLRNGALAVAGTAAIPSFLTRAAYGALESGNRAKRLVVIFQRGAADGLNIVVPHGEQARSEEHTSELQSLTNLVCRLLLEFSSHQRMLPTFPTRRSSDLPADIPEKWCARGRRHRRHPVIPHTRCLRRARIR